MPVSAPFLSEAGAESVRIRCIIHRSLLKNRGALNGTDWLALGLSFVVAFLVAWASIRWLLRYVSSHSFRAFAWYRLAFGLIILAVFWNLD